MARLTKIIWRSLIMADPVTALVVGGTTLLGGAIQSRSAGKASQAQQQAAEQGIEEQRRQFDAVQEILSPYVQAGTTALGGLQPFAAAGAPALEQQQALLGLRGPEAQRAAIAAVEQGAGFQAQVRQGEEAILQSASATGGLRGGNIQAALSQFRPQMLQREIDLQYGRLGGMTELGVNTQQNIAQLGQASAAGTATAGLQTGARVSGLLGEIGSARAGADLARGQALSGAFNLPAQFLGLQYGMGATPNIGLGGFGGGGTATGGVAANQTAFSDSRLKTNIQRISTRPDGLGVYEFEYIWGGGKQIGLMAQEVLGIYPDAVGSVGGYYTVDYSRV
jgi:hypothetical protein